MAMVFFRYGIITAVVKGVAFTDSFNGKPAAFDGAMYLYSFISIFGARGVESA